MKQQIFPKEKKRNLKIIIKDLEAKSKGKKARIFVDERIILREIDYQLGNNMIKNKNGDLIAVSQNILID